MTEVKSESQAKRVVVMQQDRLDVAREVILNFTRACNKEHVRRGDWACELCIAGEKWMNHHGDD